jgi:hypothetical protein
MRRLVLTSGDSGAGALKGAGLADCVIPVESRFAWGQLPSPRELQQWLAPRSTADDARGSRWLDNLRDKPIEEAQRRGPGLVEFCARFDAIELWIDPEPNAQLMLIWLLDYFRPHERIVSKLNLVDEGPFTSAMHDDRDRHARYKQTRLSLTELGQAVLAGRDDFSQHNPIRRWWGGTESTNDRLWRWDPVKQALIAP